MDDEIYESVTQLIPGKVKKSIATLEVYRGCLSGRPELSKHDHDLLDAINYGIVALRARLPERPLHNNVTKKYFCPNCTGTVYQSIDPIVCGHCGQILTWRE